MTSLVNSRVDFLNSFNVWPNARPISGNFFGPNIIKAKTRISINPGIPIFDNIYAGLSGPGIKPIALRMVHEVCKNVKIPVMGMGGITDYKDALEFIMAGANVVQIGTANFINPKIGIEIINDLEKFLNDNNIKSIEEIRGII